jgi:hypothetical protein
MCHFAIPVFQSSCLIKLKISPVDGIIILDVQIHCTLLCFQHPADITAKPDRMFVLYHFDGRSLQRQYVEI